MSRRSKQHRLPFLMTLLFAISVIMGGLATPAAAASSASATQSAQGSWSSLARALEQPLTPQSTGAGVTLLIHGVGDASDHLKAGCDSTTTWGPTESFLNTLGLYNYSLGYYKNDYNCGDNIYTYEQQHQHCIKAFDSGSDDGTWNDDDRHVACELAWYIYDTYTSKGEAANIVAHSLGGVLIKEALYQIEVAHNTVFPTHLLLSHIVTISSPLGGVPVFGDEGCNGCFQIFQLINNDNSYAIYHDLTSAAGQAVGKADGITWTMIGQADGNLGCDHVGDSAFKMSYGIKYDYSQPIPGITTSMEDACAVPPTFQLYYGHGTYLVDTQTANDVTVNYCSGCAGDPLTPINNFRHSINAVYAGLIADYPVVNVPNGGTFLTKWEQMSDITGLLGAPTGNWFPLTSGQEQDFQGGSIYWSAATNTYEVQGAIHSEYASVMGGPNGGLGFPTSDELSISSGSVSYFYGALCGIGSRGPNNSGSAIYYSTGTGAHFVWGCIYDKYWTIQGPGGMLGFPVTDELPVAGGHASYFAGQVCNGGYVVNGQTSGSAIFDTPGTGAHEVQGCIYQEYEQIGGPGALGFPLQDEQGVAGGRVSYFAGGGGPCGGSGSYGSSSAIFDTPSTHAHAVQGCVYATYLRLGGPTGRLGFPVSDQNTLTDSSGTRIGWASYVQGTGCGSQSGPYGSTAAIYVPASNNTASAGHEVQGCIFLTYAQTWGGAAGPLGFPTTDEYTNNFGDPESDFQNGSIVWHNGQALVTLNNPGCGAQSAC